MHYFWVLYFNELLVGFVFLVIFQDDLYEFEAFQDMFLQFFVFLLLHPQEQFLHHRIGLQVVAHLRVCFCQTKHKFAVVLERLGSRGVCQFPSSQQVGQGALTVPTEEVDASQEVVVFPHGLAVSPEEDFLQAEGLGGMLESFVV